MKLGRTGWMDALTYDRETGRFTWRVAPNRRIRCGSPAGSRDDRGYVEIQLSGDRQYAHRLAWLFETGAWPSDEVDHRNGVKDDNRWSNLREASGTVNQQNRQAAQRNSGTGLLGVLTQGKGRYCARIRVDGKNRHLGSFTSPELAHAAYLAAKRKLHSGCTI